MEEIEQSSVEDLGLSSEQMKNSSEVCMGEKTKSTGEMRGGRGGIVSAGARCGGMRKFFEDKTKSTFCAN